MKNKCDFPLDCSPICHFFLSQIFDPHRYLNVSLRCHYLVEFLNKIEAIRQSFETFEHSLVFFRSPMTFIVEQAVVQVSMLVLRIVLYLRAQVFCESPNGLKFLLSIRECFLKHLRFHSNLL